MMNKINSKNGPWLICEMENMKTFRVLGKWLCNSDRDKFYKQNAENAKPKGQDQSSKIKTKEY